MRYKDRKDIQWSIREELAEGTHTFTMCQCGRRGCRGEKCWECWLSVLVEGRPKKDAQDNSNENHSPAETGGEISSDKSSSGDALCECGHTKYNHFIGKRDCSDFNDMIRCNCKKFVKQNTNEED